MTSAADEYRATSQSRDYRPSSGSDAYVEAAVQRMLAEDPALAEQGLRLRRGEDRLLVQGEVESPHRRDEIQRRIGEQFPDVQIECDIGVTRTHAPNDVEEL